MREFLILFGILAIIGYALPDVTPSEYIKSVKAMEADCTQSGGVLIVTEMSNDKMVLRCNPKSGVK